MRKLMTIFTMLGALSGLGLAETWSGTLLDADCYHRHQDTKACDAKRSTTAFLLDSNGVKYRLDFRSNDEARSAVMELHNHKATPITATITGRTRSNGKIRGDIIAVQ